MTEHADPDPRPLGQVIWYDDADTPETTVCTLSESAEGPTITCDREPMPAALREFLDAYQHRAAHPIAQLVTGLLAALVAVTV